jgi:phosphatidylserine decarboxylase
LVGWLTTPLWAAPSILLAVFFFWFFRDPERAVPVAPNLMVSPADGKVTNICRTTFEGVSYLHISIFLNVFDVHVNRSPIAGVIRRVSYQKGKFLNAMNPASADQNEQNLVTVEGEGQTVIFKQIAGLLARRIVFSKSLGDRVERGERVGLIKFGSRVDVLFPTSAGIQVKVGDRVKGGLSVLAHLTAKSQLMTAGAEGARQGAR